MNFREEYAGLREENLLIIAADRAHLLPEAAQAMDAELAHRGLTYEDARAKKKEGARREYREFSRRRPSKKFTQYLVPRANSGMLLLLALGVPLLILSLWGLHFISDLWLFPVLTVCMGLIIGIYGVQPWLRRTASFWIALTVSCGVQLSVAWWISVRTAPLAAKSSMKGAAFLSLFAGYVVGAPIFLLLQKLKPNQKPLEP